ncbi:MAG: amino acid dehydrogenase [Alphaproteobacteria bacterium]|nr:amino acid dehydrogenase [Alphaproteobacteria bacterium]
MIFSQTDFDGHEMVTAFCDQRAKLRGFIGVHSTALGPAFGGCRMWPYVDEAAAIRDVLRLSRGMSYKNAMAGLPYGGGKAVIVADPRSDKTPELFKAFGRMVDRLGGTYMTAEDVGITVDDMRIVATETVHVGGIPQEDGYRGGDPSPITARGVFAGIKATARHALGSADLAGVTVAVQGAGHVGYNLCRLLHEAGASIKVSDINAENVARVQAEFGAEAVDPAVFFEVDADIIAPCALGSVLNKTTIPLIKAKVIAGAANNQLAGAADGERLHNRGILYAPDYVINAGGIISVAAERDDAATQASVLAKVDGIGERLREIYERSDESGRAPHEVADHIAREIMQRAEENGRNV